MWKFFKYFGMAVALLAVAFFAAVYFLGTQVLDPNLPPEKLRVQAHELLERGQSVHDACLMLIRHADQTSIPVLEKVLQTAPSPEPGGAIECTWAHCAEALAKAQAQLIDTR